MKRNKIATLGLIFPLVACLTLPLFGDKFVDRVEESTNVYKALIKAKDGGVPASLLKKCQCVVVIPHVIKLLLVSGVGTEMELPVAREEGEMESTLFCQIVRRELWVSNWCPILGYGFVPDDREEYTGSVGE